MLEPPAGPKAAGVRPDGAAPVRPLKVSPKIVPHSFRVL
jgi:hypothetical protein